MPFHCFSVNYSEYHNLNLIFCFEFFYFIFVCSACCRVLKEEVVVEGKLFCQYASDMSCDNYFTVIRKK